VRPVPEVRGARRRRPAALSWALWALAAAGLAATAWFDHLLRAGGRPDLIQIQASTVPYLLASMVAATVGAVLAGRRPRHPVGWLLLALGLSVAASGVADGAARYGLVARPGALPGATWAATFSPATLLLAMSCVGFVLLLTPTGTLPMGDGWRWWARIAAAAPPLLLVALAFGPFTIPPYESLDKQLAVPALDGVLLVATALSVGVIAAGLVLGAWSLLLRFRRARGVERLQLRWVALAAGICGLGAVVVPAAMLLDATALLLLVLGVCLAILPLAVGAAILRYRLYDMDRIISRTLAYGLLTVLLGGGYAAVVLGLGALLGHRSSLLVAAATLALAAVFQPARRRVQRLFDHRFDRRRYDASQTIAAFSGRMRQQIDLDTLTAELLGVVEQTMQPTRLALWLRPHGPPAAGGPR
jgi:hypothetical protein